MAARLPAALLVLALLPTLAFGQATTGTINGVVTDTTKAILPGVTILVTSTGTGVTRTVTTDERGRYRVFSLTPGTYKVTADLTGFAPVTRNDITVNINREVAVDIVLELGTVTENVTVSGESSTVELSSAAVVGVVSTQQIAELPLNGRNFIQLATLQPGVVTSRATGNSFHAGYAGTTVSVAGARPEMAGYLLEGTNIADVADKSPSSVAGVMLGVDAIQEFSVQTQGYSAEYGRAAGGVVSAVTKSGSNSLHGTAFEFARNSAMDAANFFDRGEKQPFKRNQFGGTAGGPIVRNRLFYFGSYEGLRQQLAQTMSARLPNQAAHNGFLPDGRGGLKFVGVHPLIKPYLDLLFPIPTGRDFGDGSADLEFALKNPIRENLYVGKIDWQVSSKDSLSVRLSSDKANSTTPGGGASGNTANPLFNNVTHTDTRYFTTQYQRVFSSTALNVVRGAVNRTFRTNDTVPLIDIPSSLYYTSIPYYGGIVITGLTGVPSGSPSEYIQTLFQVNDTFTWSKSRHTMKFGFDLQRTHFQPYSYQAYGGEFSFRTLEEFLTLTRAGGGAADRYNGQVPGASDTRRNMWQNYWAVFAQDEFAVSNRVTLNYGVRYEGVTTPYDSEDRVAGLLSLDDLESGPKGVTMGSPMFKVPRPWVVPRLGVSWDPTGSGKTSVRGGFGLFTQPLTSSYYRGTVSRIFPFFAGVNMRQPAVFGPAINDVLMQGHGVNVLKRSEFIMWDAKQPYMAQYNFNVQHQIADGLVAEMGFLGSRGYDLPFYGDPNSVPAEQMADGRWRIVPGANIRYPSWGRMRTKKNEANSWYKGLIVGLNRRFKNDLMFQASYTLGKATDTWSAGLLGSNDFSNGAGSATNWWCVECEHGLSNYDVRHTLVLNAMYQLPFGKNATGAAGAIARGWQIGVIVNIASAIPFTPYVGFDRAGDRQTDTGMQKPDVNPSFSGNVLIGSPDNWYDANAFLLPQAGYYGNAGRNTLKGPNLRTVDLSIFKNIPMGRTLLQLRAEAFNVLNRANFGTPDDSALFAANGTRRASATRITNTATTSRQVQLGIKLLF